MTTQPPRKLILSMAAPTVISMLVTSFYNMADTFFVGSIGTSASGSIGVAYTLMTLIQACGFLCGQGSGSFISRALGRRDSASASTMAAVGFVTAFGLGLLIMILGLVFLEPMALLFGSTETILPYAKGYMRFILIGAPYMCASFVMNNQLRYQGNAMYSMVGLAAGAVLNVGLDPLLIFVFKMGVPGASLATIISQFVSFCILYIGTLKSDNIKIRLKNYRFSWYYYKNILRGGAPSFCRQGITGFSAALLNTLSKPYGDATIAAMAIVSKITMFIISAMLGFGQGYQPFCGFNYGAKKYARILEGYRFCRTVMLIFLVALAVAGFIFAPGIITLFRRGDPEVIRVGAMALRLQCITLPVSSLFIISSMTYQTIGWVWRGLAMSLSRSGLFFIPSILVLTHFFGQTGILIAQPAADLMMLILALTLQVSMVKRLKLGEG